MKGFTRIKTNFLGKLIEKCTKTINNSKLIVEEKIKFYILILNLQIFKLYALPKIHKFGVDIKPIVSSIILCSNFWFGQVFY